MRKPMVNTEVVINANAALDVDCFAHILLCMYSNLISYSTVNF